MRSPSKQPLSSTLCAAGCNELIFIVLFIFKAKQACGICLRYTSSCSESMRHDPRSLCDFAAVQKKNSGRRSLCQEFCFSLPRGLQRCIFLLQQVPRLYQCYHFIATPYPTASSPPTRRHRWHWLRCAKNLLMCLNYLRLMLGAKRLQQCPGTALFLWWKFFEDHSFASYFVALPQEMPRGSEAIRNTLINS